MAIFLTIALISIIPTVTFLRFNARLDVAGSIVLEDDEYRRLRGILWLEIALFVLLPFCAALMANGI